MNGKENGIGLYCCAISYIVFQILYLLSPLVSRAICKSYREWDKYTQVDWDTRIVSSIHAIFVSVIALQQLVLNPLINADPAFYRDDMTEGIIGIVLGYFFYDTLLLLWYINGLPGVALNLVHHLSGLFTFFLCIHSQTGHFFALVFTFTEISTPVVNLRWMLYKTGLKSSPLYVANGIVLASVFFLARVLTFPWILYTLYISWDRVVQMPSLPFYSYWTGFIATSILNHYWFYLIAKGLYKVLSAHKTKLKNA